MPVASPLRMLVRKVVKKMIWISQKVPMMMAQPRKPKLISAAGSVAGFSLLLALSLFSAFALGAMPNQK